MHYPGHSGQHSDPSTVLQPSTCTSNVSTPVRYCSPGTCTSNISTPERAEQLWDHPGSYSTATGGCTPEVKRPGREPHDHSLPSSANAKRECGNTFTPLYAVMACLQTTLPLPLPLSVIVCILYFNISQLTWRWLRDTPSQGSPTIYNLCRQPGFSHDLQSLPPATVPCPQSGFSHDPQFLPPASVLPRKEPMIPTGHGAGWRGTISKFWNIQIL